VQSLPLREFPDLGLHVSIPGANFRENWRGRFQVEDRVLGAAGMMQQVRQITVQRRLAMAVTNRSFAVNFVFDQPYQEGFSVVVAALHRVRS